jgi:hypothetical protein
MRKLTKEAIAAFNEARPLKKSNTEIRVLPNVTVMVLFGNEIAYRYNDPERTLTITNCGWDTNATKERLNAIDGVSINQVKGQWFLNGELWDGSLIDIS